MKEFAYLVNALLKSTVKGHFVMRNGCIVHDVEPFDDYDEIFGDEIFEVAFTKDNTRYETLLDGSGHSITDREYDIVEFVKE